MAANRREGPGQGSSFVRRLRIIATIGLAIVAAQFVPGAIRPGGATTGNVTYCYDPAGRLVGVVDGSGNFAQYSYDALGNLTSVSNSNPNGVEAFSVSPNNGPIGLTVTFCGVGFSATPSQNTVTFFSGAQATVVASTTTTLTVTVPSGASTGTVSITTPSGNNPAAAVFTVTAN